MRYLLCILALMTIRVTAIGQSDGLSLPCAFHGDLLRGPDGNVVRFPSNEMKKRATHKEDLGGIFHVVDGRAVVIVDVLVGANGEVVCTKALTLQNIFSGGVEKALTGWTFTPEVQKGRPVSYLGRLEFTLCNTSCRDGEWSMTLLK